MIKIKSIQTSKTARYVLSNNPSNKIKNVWIICHGYGQTSIGFLKWFNPIFSEDTIVNAHLEAIRKEFDSVVTIGANGSDTEEEVSDMIV